ncbi:hypothetical protein ACRAWD_11435 [Caulobacter segnis]
MKARAEVAALARAMSDLNNNQPPMPGIYPDHAAPIITRGEDGQRVMRDARWGMPSSKQGLFEAATLRADKLRAKGTEFDFDELLRMEPDKGTTNIRHATSKTTGKTNRHWAPWLGAGNRYLVPLHLVRRGLTRTTRRPARTSGSRSTTTAPSPSSPASGRLRLRADDQQGLGGDRRLRLLDDGLRRACEDLPLQGHAGDPDRTRRVGPLDERRALDRGRPAARPHPDRLKIVAVGGKSDGVVPA